LLSQLPLLSLLPLLLQLFFWFVIPAGNLLLLLLLPLPLLLLLPFWFVIPRRSRANLLPPVLRPHHQKLARKHQSSTPAATNQSLSK
jgi:hypothetical protein